jgi:hypothetical protein
VLVYTKFLPIQEELVTHTFSGLYKMELPKSNSDDHGIPAGLTARRAEDSALAKMPSTVFTYPCNDHDSDAIQDIQMRGQSKRRWRQKEWRRNEKC